LVPQPGTRHLLHRRKPALDNEATHDTPDDRARHEFLLATGRKKEEEDEEKHFRRLPSWRQIRTHWAAHGPEICFTVLVVSMQLAFEVRQLAKYLTTEKYCAGFRMGSRPGQGVRRRALSHVFLPRPEHVA